jgi:hypothetical protein
MSISLFGAANALFGKDKPNMKLLEIVKNQNIQKILDPAIDRVGESMGMMDGDIARFRKMFEEQTPEFERYAKEGVGQIDDITGGRFEQWLRGLRGQEKEARRGATEASMRRLQGADKSNRARMGVKSGGNSYLDALKARMMRDTETEAAMANAAQERADFGTLKQMQLGTIGQRESILNQLLNRTLSRGNMEAGAQGGSLNVLGALQGMDDANKFRGLYKKRSTLDRLSDFENIANTDAQNMISTAGSIAGLMGAFCWVARAVYGEDDVRWRLFRYWLLTEAPVDLVKFYGVCGQRMAEMVRGSDSLRMRVKAWMNKRIANATDLR